MKKLVATFLSLSILTSILAGCGASAPNSVWTPREISDSSRAPAAR